jgi:hypothetical protein
VSCRRLPLRRWPRRPYRMVETAHRPQPFRVGSRRCRERQVRDSGWRLPRHQSTGRHILESGEHGFRGLYRKSHIHAGEAGQPPLLLRAHLRRRNLDGAELSYLYFQIEQNGTWLIKSRNGNATQQLSQKTPSDAVKKMDTNGTSVNTLEVRVGTDKIAFVVNGVVVNSAPKTDAFAKTDAFTASASPTCWKFRSTASASRSSPQRGTPLFRLC